MGRDDRLSTLGEKGLWARDTRSSLPTPVPASTSRWRRPVSACATATAMACCCGRNSKFFACENNPVGEKISSTWRTRSGAEDSSAGRYIGDSEPGSAVGAMQPARTGRAGAGNDRRQGDLGPKQAKAWTTNGALVVQPSGCPLPAVEGMADRVTQSGRRSFPSVRGKWGAWMPIRARGG